eukprot:13919296-Heterocapsa_arctica.AAC.1
MRNGHKAAASNDWVCKQLNLVPPAVEVQARRVKMWQSIVEHPGDFAQLIAVFFGSMVHGNDPLKPDGTISSKAHTRMHLLGKDLLRLSEIMD